MEIFVNRNTGGLIQGIRNPEALRDGRIETKRGDSKVFDIHYVVPFVSEGGDDIGTPTSFKFGAKVAGDFDGSYVVSNYIDGDFAFTKTTVGDSTSYRVAPGWNTVKLNNLLGNDPEGFAEVTEIRTVDDLSASLDGKHFLLHDAAGSVGVWIDIDDSGTTAPAGALAAARQIEVTTIATGDAAGTIATKLAAALHADAAFTASATGSLVTVTATSVGPRTAATPGDSGFTVTRWITGSLPNTLPNLPHVDLDAEIEVIVSGNIESTTTFTVRALNDINRGSEGVPVNGTPIYPLPSEILLKAGNLAGLANVPAARGNLGISVGALINKVSVPADDAVGAPGDFAASGQYLYLYTGDGATHTWLRIAGANEF